MEGDVGGGVAAWTAVARASCPSEKEMEVASWPSRAHLRSEDQVWPSMAKYDQV